MYQWNDANLSFLANFILSAYLLGLNLREFISDKNCCIEDLSIEELKTISDVFEADLYDAITLKTCVEKRLVTGGPSSKAMTDYLNSL